MTLLAAACGADPTPTSTPIPVASAGDTVAVHYHGTLDDGSVFDSSLERDPLEFTLGTGQVIPGFDNAVDGLAVGESVTVRIPPEEAYGLAAGESEPYAIDATALPEGTVAGDVLQFSDGSTARVISIEGEGAIVTITQAGHPLAGEALTFEITLVEIK